MRKDVSNLLRKFLEELDSMEQRGEYPKTTWDIFISLAKTKYDVIILTLKADMAILKLVVDGLSPYAISKRLGIPSKNVFDACYTWGFIPQISSLDINPVYLYKRGMSYNNFLDLYNITTPLTIDIDSARRAVLNIEHFHDIQDFIKEYDDGKSYFA